jgi:(S)-mandelate dehydrogenase
MKRHYYSGRDVSRARSIEELRQMAVRRLPNFCLEYLEGGAEDEITLQRNRTVFDDIAFAPRTLVDITSRTLHRDLFGKRIEAPFAISPTGFNGMLTHEGDFALAKAAGDAGIPFGLSITSNAPLEEIARRTEGRHWMQVYLYRSRDFVRSIAERARAAGFETLIVTTDVPAYGNREWDMRSFRAPAKLTARNMIDTALHPRWIFDVLVPHGMPRFGNLSDLLPPGKDSAAGASSLIAREINPSLNWDDIKWVRDLWPGKLVVKGILTVEDANLAVSCGADGIVLTNHGGRQLDGAIPALAALPDVAAAVGGHTTILIDGGFRRGTDIVKACALGADAVLLGRATLYGLAAGGEAGAARAINLLKEEVSRTLGLLGCPDINQVGPEFLRPARSELCQGRRLPVEHSGRSALHTGWDQAEQPTRAQNQ